jgi:hypothetical protein
MAALPLSFSMAIDAFHMAVVSAFPQVGRRIWSGVWMFGLSRLVPVMGGLVA